MMSPPKSSVLIILIISLSLSLCFWEGDAQVAVEGFHLAILWPPAFCSLSPKICNTTKVKEEFTIHGLWPYDINLVSLINCLNASAFNVNNVKDIRPALDSAWPTYDKGTNEEFWKKEWDKHGSCSEYAKYPTQILLSQTNYFERSLTAWNKTKLTSTLKNAGIIPNDKNYKVQDIIDAVAGTKKLNPVVVCKTNNANQVLLSEIYVCLGKKAIDIISCKDKQLQVSCGGLNATVKFLKKS